VQDVVAGNATQQLSNHIQHKVCTIFFTLAPENAPASVLCMQWFNAADTDNSGTIDVHELRRALGNADFHYSLMLCQQLIRLHNTRRTKDINVQV
jgi:hypothetical protein